MNVVIDQEKCNGAGICVQMVPELFRFQEGSKKGIATQRTVSPSLEANVRRAAKQCPAGAIIIMEK